MASPLATVHEEVGVVRIPTTQDEITDDVGIQNSRQQHTPEIGATPLLQQENTRTPISPEIGSPQDTSYSENTTALTTKDTDTPSKLPSRRSRRKKTQKIPGPDKLNWMMHMAFLQKDFESCKKLAELQLTETSGQCEYALYVLGHLLRLQGQMDEALEAFQKAMHLNPLRNDNAKQVAQTLLLMSRHRSSIAVYEQILNAGVRDWNVIHNLGVAYYHTGDLDKSKAFLEEALSLNKQDITFVQLSKVHLQQGNASSAISTLEAALKYSPENADILTALGLLHLETGTPHKAFDLFGSALTHDSTHTQALVGASSILQANDEHDVALVKYRVAAAKSPSSYSVWNNVGMCFFAKKKFVAAIACLKHALYFSPLSWEICYNLGLAHLHSEQYVSAFHFISAAVNLNPGHALSYMLLGAALMYLEDATNARKAFLKAMEMESDNPLICLNYTTLLYNSGDLQGASEIFVLYEKCKPKLADDDQLMDLEKDMTSLDQKLLPAIQLGT